MARQRNRPQWRRIVQIAPAVATDWTLRNDRGSLWLIRSIIFSLVTDANVANRSVAIQVTAGEDVWFRTVSAVVQAASLTRTYSAFTGSPAGADNASAILMAWPTDGLWVPPGHVVSSLTGLIQAGDQFGALLADVVEYPETVMANLIPSPFLYEDSESE